MARFVVLIILACVPVVRGDAPTCMDAVNLMTQVHRRINEQWFNTCNVAATDAIGKNLCAEVHAVLVKAIK